MGFSSESIKDIVDYAIDDYLAPGMNVQYYKGNTLVTKSSSIDQCLGAPDNIEGQMLSLDRIVLYSNKYLNSKEGMREEILFSTFWSNINIVELSKPEDWQKSYSYLLERMENIIRVFLGILAPNMNTSKMTMLDFTSENNCRILTGNAADIIDFRDMINTVRRYRNGTLHGKVGLTLDDETTKLTPPEVTGYKVGSPLYQKKQIENYKAIIQLCVSLILLIIRYNQSTIDAFLNRYDLTEANDSSQEQVFDVEANFFVPYINNLRRKAESAISSHNIAVGAKGNNTNHIINIRAQSVSEKEQENDGGNDDILTCSFVQGLDSQSVKFCILLGQPGAGKSTAMYSVVEQYCQRWKSSNESILPIHIPLCAISEDAHLRDIATQGLLSLPNMKSAEQRVIDKYNELIQKGRVAIILDGLDELTCKDFEHKKSFITRLLDDWSESYQKCRIILTCRSYEFNPLKNLFADIVGLSIYELQGIDAKVIKDYLHSLGLTNELLSKFDESILQNDNMKVLLSSPLNLSLLLKIIGKRGNDGVLTDVSNAVNRGELLDLFMRSILSDKKTLDTSIDESTFSLLEDLAQTLSDKGSEEVLESSFIDSQQDKKALINRCVGLQVLRRGQDDLLRDTISFEIVTYKEYFLARRAARLFVGENKWPALFSLKDHDKIETLKLVLELVCGDCVTSADLSWKKGLEIVQRLYSDARGEATIAKKSIAEDKPITATLIGFNKKESQMIQRLAKLVSSTRVNEKKNRNARTQVEQWILNRMVVYRMQNPSPLVDQDDGYLLALFSAASTLTCSSKIKSDSIGDALFHELFSVYWLGVLGFIPAKEILQLSFPINAISSKRFQASLISGAGDPRLLFDAMFDCYNLFIKGKIQGVGQTAFVFFDLLFGLLGDKKKLLYEHLENKERLYDEKDVRRVFLRTFRLGLLMFISDPDYICARMPILLKEQSGFVISLRQLKAILRSAHNPRVADLVCSDGFISTFPDPSGDRDQREGFDRLLSHLLRFFIFSGYYPSAIFTGECPLIQRLHNKNAILELLDAIPFDLIPEDVAKKYYSMETVQYLQSSQSRETESGQLHYSFYDSGDNYIKLSIPDVVSNLLDLVVEYRVNGKTQIAKVQSDNYEDEIESDYIITRNDGQLLPATGTLSANSCEIEYNSPCGGREIHIKCNSPKNRLLLTQLLGSEVYVDNAPCRIEADYSVCRVPTYHRVITLTRTEGMPLPESSGVVSIRERDGKPFSINTIIKNDGLLRIHERFIQPSHKIVSLVHYGVFGGTRQVIQLLTSKILNPSLYYFSCVREKRGKGLFQVVSIDNMDRSYAEVSLNSYVSWPIPQSGIMIWDKGDRVESYPYIFRNSEQTKHILRIIDSSFVEHLTDEAFIESLRTANLRVNGLQLKFESIELCKPESRQSIWTLRPLSDTDELSLEGEFEIFQGTDCKRIMHVTYAQGDCGNNPVLKGIRCIGINKNTFRFLVEPNTIINRDLFVRCTQSSLPLKTKTGSYVYSNVYLVQLDNLEYRMPPFFTAKFDCTGDIEFEVLRTKESKNGSITAYVSPVDRACELSDFKALIQKAHTLEYVDNNNNSIFSTVSVAENVVSIENAWGFEAFANNLLLKDYAAFASCDEMELLVHKGVINTIKTAVKAQRKTLIVESIPYDYVGAGKVKISKPDTPIDGFFVELDGGLRCRFNTPEESSDKGISYYILTPRTARGNTPAIKEEGGILRFYINEKGKTPVKVGYDALLKYIAFNQPQKYHSDICHLLVDELKAIPIMNGVVIDFFISKSSAHLLLKNPAMLAQIERLRLPSQKFNICAVTENSKNQMLCAWSPLVASSNLKNAELYSGDAIDDEYRIGDLIVYEKNHQIHKLDVESMPRIVALGFLKGTVVQYSRKEDKTDSFINVNDYKEDFFLPGCAPQRGVCLSFFPTINKEYSIRKGSRTKKDAYQPKPMAIHIKEEGFSNLTRLQIKEKKQEFSEDGSAFWLLKMESKGGKKSYNRMVKPRQKEEWEIVNDVPEGESVYAFVTTNEDVYIISANPVCNE